MFNKRRQHAWGLRFNVKAARRVILASGLLFTGLAARGDLPIYIDSLQMGWLDTDPPTIDNFNFANSAPVYSGSYSISCTISAGQLLAQLEVAGDPPWYDVTPYQALAFEINGGAYGLDWITVLTMYMDHSFLVNNYPTYGLGPVPVNTWRDISVALPTADIQDPTDFLGFLILAGYNPDRAIPVDSSFYIDDIRLSGRFLLPAACG